MSVLGLIFHTEGKMYLIVGLGNPGKEYQNTRHNLGFMVVDELASRLGIKSYKSKCQSFIASERILNHKVILAQPQTFMNNSGQAVGELINWFKIEPEKIILIYDDVDLEVGQLRIREKGGAGGHHGVESVLNQVGTTTFARVRIGIDRPSPIGDVSDYVLQSIPTGQREVLSEAVIKAADAVEKIVADGVALAMTQFNN